VQSSPVFAGFGRAFAVAVNVGNIVGPSQHVHTVVVDDRAMPGVLQPVGVNIQ
jgi:hypothetical protein